MTQKTHPLDQKPPPHQSTLTQETTRAKNKADEKESATKQKTDDQKEQKEHKGGR